MAVGHRTAGSWRTSQDAAGCDGARNSGPGVRGVDVSVVSDPNCGLEGGDTVHCEVREGCDLDADGRDRSQDSNNVLRSTTIWEGKL